MWRRSLVDDGVGFRCGVSWSTDHILPPGGRVPDRVQP